MKKLLLLCLLALCTVSLLADEVEVVLKSGRKIRGEIISEDAKTLVLKRGSGGATMTTPVLISQIASRKVIKTESTAPAAEVSRGTPSSGTTDANSSNATVEKSHTALLSTVQNFLVDKTGRRRSADSVGRARYVALYFSAHWCPPCQRFTPVLVDFYRKNKSGDNFEIIFVSSDRDPAEMKKYMMERNMPWPATAYKSVAQDKLNNKYGGNGIPCVVVLDGDDNVVAHSYVNGEYRGPQEPIDTMMRLLEE
ncbi:MAG: thioredoxin-like domain-containing protein [Verrucomicrobiota bacterium]|nr:thioredoxin-like domain-containing protein [Verrucomicrobiota bacterium]